MVVVVVIPQKLYPQYKLQLGNSVYSPLSIITLIIRHARCIFREVFGMNDEDVKLMISWFSDVIPSGLLCGTTQKGRGCHVLTDNLTHLLMAEKIICHRQHRSLYFVNNLANFAL